LAKLARKKITIVWRMSGFFVFCLLLTHLLTRRPLMFKGKKKNGKTHPPLLVEERERETHFVTLYSSNTKSGTHFFHSFSTNAEETKKEKDPFFPLHLSKIEIERNPTFSP